MARIDQTTNSLSVDTDVLFVNITNNRVGINQNNPNTPLHVVGATTIDGNITSTSGTIQGVTLVIQSGGGGSLTFADGTSISTAPSAPDLAGAIDTGQVAFGASSNTIAGNNDLFWDNSNTRLGIGTNVPLYPLDVRGGDDNDISIIGSGSIGVQNSAEITPPSNRAWGFLSIDTGSTMVAGNIRLDDGVIGGSHAGYESGTDDRGGSGIIFTNANGTTGQMAFIRKNDTNDDTWVVTESMRIDENGNLGIGTNNPSAKLHVVGTVRQSNATDAIIYADANGDIGELTVGSGLSLTGSTLTATGGGGGSSTFIGLTDTPAAYAGAAGKMVIVNGTEDGLDFASGGGGGSPAGANTQVQWNDNGSFGASADVTYDSGANEFGLGASSNRTTFLHFGSFTIGEGGDNRIGGNSLSIRSTITIISDDPANRVGFYGSAGIAQYTTGDPAALPPDPAALQAWLIELYNAIGPAGMNIIA